MFGELVCDCESMVQWITLKVCIVVAGDVFTKNWNVVEFIEKNDIFC